MNTAPVLNENDAILALTKAKEELLKLTVAKENYLRQNKLKFFKPNNWKQEAFFSNAGAKRRAVFAGNRFGKSTIGAVECVCWLIGERPFFAEDDTRRRLGIPSYGVKILCVAENWDKVHQLFTNSGKLLDKPGKIFEFMPGDAELTFHKTQTGVIDIIYVTVRKGSYERKSALFFDTVSSFKNSPMSLESQDWDALWIDEPMPQDMYNAITRGFLDRGGAVWGLLTSLTEPWLFYHFEENAPENEQRNGFWWITGTSDENPTLSEEEKRLYFSNLDPIERECRRNGRPLAFGSLVIPTYDEEKHLWDTRKPWEEGKHQGLPPGWIDAYTPPKDYYCAYAIDTHPQTPTAVLFVAISPTGHVFFYDELWIGGTQKDRISDVAAEIILRTNKVSCEIELCEPGAWVRDPETGRCFADVLRENGLYVVKASKERTYAIQQTRILFASDRKVYVMDHCYNLRREIKRWSYGRENRPSDKDDHFCECLGRLVVHDGLVYRSPYHIRNITNSASEAPSVHDMIHTRPAFNLTNDKPWLS